MIWCGKDCDLDSLAKWTRVEWHNNPAKLHVFFISKTPLSNKKEKGIEVYNERPNLICVFGFHKDGNRIEPYNTEKIAVVDDVKLLDIQDRIRSVIPDYNCHHDNTAAHNHILDLERSETVIGSGHVHNAMAIYVFKFVSKTFFWKDIIVVYRASRVMDNRIFGPIVRNVSCQWKCP